MLGNQCHQAVNLQLTDFHIGQGLHIDVHLIAQENGSLVDDGAGAENVHDE